MIIILKDSDPRTTRSQGPRTTSAFVLYKDLPLQYISTSKYVCLRSSRLFLLTDLIIYKLRLLLIPSETTTANRQSTHIVISDACFLTQIREPSQGLTPVTSSEFPYPAAAPLCLTRVKFPGTKVLSLFV
jgi:hypothetical protein